MHLPFSVHKLTITGAHGLTSLFVIFCNVRIWVVPVAEYGLSGRGIDMLYAVFMQIDITNLDYGLS